MAFASSRRTVWQLQLQLPDADERRCERTFAETAEPLNH